MAEKEGEGFVVRDKRSFFSEAAEESSEVAEEKGAEAAPRESPPEAETRGEADEEAQFPEVNFSTFVFSLSSSAMLHFGEIADPSTGSKKKNLPMAKHTIDILGMLEEKTKGNLTDDEEKLLSNILYDLRMRYVREKS